MTNPRTRFGRSSVRVSETLTVDYTIVLHQAVENERLRVLREVRNALEKTPTSTQGSSSNAWREDVISAGKFREAMYKHLDTIEQARTAVS